MSGMTLGQAIAADLKLAEAEIERLRAELAELKSREVWRSPDEPPDYSDTFHVTVVGADGPIVTPLYYAGSGVGAWWY